MSDQARTLIHSAFEKARESGKPDWRRMSLAVLKNRFLQLTRNQFREQDFGATNILAFARMFEDLLEVDESSRPFAVVLRSSTANPTDGNANQLTLTAAGNSQELYADSPGSRVRPDLWSAVMDYSSGKRFGWDPQQQRARPLEAGEQFPVIPTITAEDVQAWRKAFAEVHTPTLAGVSLDKLNAWCGQGLVTNALPPALRKPWNAELKRQAVKRLQSWFEAQHLPVPTILVYSAPAEARTEDVESLRRYVLACVEVMTKQELEELRLPVGVHWRARN